MQLFFPPFHFPLRWHNYCITKPALQIRICFLRSDLDPENIVPDRQLWQKLKLGLEEYQAEEKGGR